MSARLFDPTAASVGREVKLAQRPPRLDGLHPIVNLGDNELDARADRPAEEVLALLQGER